MMKKYGFGVDIGGTTCKIGLFETTGTLLDKWEIPTRTEDAGVHILEDVSESLHAKMDERQIALDELQGVGIGVPGPVDEQGVVQMCVNLGWGVFDVGRDMEARMQCKIKVGNDANVAALGEMWQGGGKGHNNIVMITLGTGVGGGVIINKKMVSGSHGAGGEIGHITVNPEETESCNCGRFGCLEQYASATGVVRLAKRALAQTTEETALRNIEPLTAKDVFDCAKANDAVAVAVVEEMTKILGETMANVACVVDPEVFVVGGGVSKAGTIITEKAKKYFDQKAFHACKSAEFKLAGLGNDAGIYGCVQMLLED